MKRKKFYSRLFQRNILPSEDEYEEKVKAELLFRINELKTKNCSCMNCQTELKTLSEYYKKIS